MRFEFPIAKAQYLFNRATEPGQGGDKRKFWRDVMGFESSEAIREAILTEVSLDILQLQSQNEHGEPEGVTRRPKGLPLADFSDL